MNSIKLQTLQNFPLIEPGDHLSSIILDCLEKNNLYLDHGDVIVIAQKVVSKSENRYVNLLDITPSSKALKISKKLNKDPAFVELIN